MKPLTAILGLGLALVVGGCNQSSDSSKDDKDISNKTATVSDEELIRQFRDQSLQDVNASLDARLEIYIAEGIEQSRLYDAKSLIDLRRIWSEGGNSISNETSRTNLEKSVCSVMALKATETDSGKALSFEYGGSGLFLSEDGFVLTAHHVIKNYMDQWTKIAQNYEVNDSRPWELLESLGTEYHRMTVNTKGVNYLVDPRFLATNDLMDLALIKVFPLHPDKKYRGPIDIQVEKEVLPRGEEVTIYGLIPPNAVPWSSTGKITTPINYHPSQFTSNISSSRGTSGGFFMTDNGRFYGIMSKIHDSKNDVPGENPGHGNVIGSHAARVARFVYNATQELERKLTEGDRKKN
jgi:hypothetical protein